MKQQDDVITISGPLLERYVTLIRLTASGIASQMGYTYENVQNIMSSISEVMEEGMKVLNDDMWKFASNFHVNEETLVIEVVFVNKGHGYKVDDKVLNEITLDLSKSIMDSVTVKQQRGNINIVINKNLHEQKGRQFGKNHNAS
jgi:hypothetical protein